MIQAFRPEQKEARHQVRHWRGNGADGGTYCALSMLSRSRAWCRARKVASLATMSFASGLF